MKVYLGKYRSNYEFIKAKLLGLEDRTQLEKTITELAVDSYVPIIVIIFYAEDILGIDLSEYKDRIIKFYGYTEILEKEEGNNG